MYPNLGSGTTQPSAPPPPPSSTLANSSAQKPVGFSSLMAQPSNQGTPYPGGQSSQTPYPSGPPSSTPYNNPYSTNNQPPNTSNYSSYSLPNTGQQPPPSQQGYKLFTIKRSSECLFLGGSGYQQSPYPPQSNPYPGPNPSSGYPGNQQPPPPSQSGQSNFDYYHNRFFLLFIETQILNVVYSMSFRLSKSIFFIKSLSITTR